MNTLFDAVEKNDIARLKELIEWGIDINEVNSYGYSALHYASSKKFIDLAIFLVHEKIDVNIPDKEDKTILHYVAEYNQFELAKIALESGASLSAIDKYGNQPLWTAVFNDKGRNDRAEMIKLFLKYGADKNHKNKVGRSPRDMMIIGGYTNLKPFLD